MKHLIDLNQCIHKVIEFDDKCSKGVSSIGSQTSESIARASSQVDEIIQGVTKKMQQMHGPPRVAKRCMDWPYLCGVCGQNHPTLQCIPKNQGMVKLEP